MPNNNTSSTQTELSPAALQNLSYYSSTRELHLEKRLKKIENKITQEIDKAIEQNNDNLDQISFSELIKNNLQTIKDYKFIKHQEKTVQEFLIKKVEESARNYFDKKTEEIKPKIYIMDFELNFDNLPTADDTAFEENSFEDEDFSQYSVQKNKETSPTEEEGTDSDQYSICIYEFNSHKNTPTNDLYKDFY